MNITAYANQSTLDTRDAEILAGIVLGEARLSALNKERIARLPIATPAQLGFEVELARCIDQSGKSLVNVMYRLSAEQKDQVKAARAEHMESLKTPETAKRIADTIANSTLTAFKVRSTKNGYAFNLRGTYGRK